MHALHVIKVTIGQISKVYILSPFPQILNVKGEEEQYKQLYQSTVFSDCVNFDIF